MIISEELVSSLHEQIAHERYNATLYLYIAGYLKNKGINNIAKHFESQHNEEIEHSKMIFDLLTDLNVPVIIPDVQGCDDNFNSILDISKIYLDREIITTESLNEIKKLAIECDCSIVEEKMRKMIELQQAEMEEAFDFQDKSAITSGDWKWVMNWDLSLG